MNAWSPRPSSSSRPSAPDRPSCDCLLGSHPDVHAPHELHLGGLKVTEEDEFTELAMRTLGLSPRDVEHLLWDRLLHRQLRGSSKSVLVEKTPGNVFIWRRLVECWPQARFVVLRRHPMAIADSIMRAGDAKDLEAAGAVVDKFAAALEQAHTGVPGSLAITYEELTTAPEDTCRALCDYLGIPWEASMLDYGRHDHGPFVYGIGDWSDRIASGRIQPATMAPDTGTVPAVLRTWCRRWKYSQ